MKGQAQSTTRFRRMSGLTRIRKQSARCSYNPYQLIHPQPNHAVLQTRNDKPTHLGAAIYICMSSKNQIPMLSERLSFKHRNTDEDNTVLHGVEKRKVNTEVSQRGQAPDGVQPKMKGDKQQNVDWLGALRESEDRQTRRLNTQTEEILATVQKMLQDTVARKAQSDNEMKLLREAFASQRPKARKELELSKQRELEQKERFHKERVEAETKHQAEIAKWDKEATSLKEDHNEQLREEKEKRTKLAFSYETMVARAKQLEKAKADAIKAAKAMTTQHKELEGKFEAVKKHYESTKQDHIRVERELEQTTSHLDRMKYLLAARTTELKDAKAFFRSEDELFCGADWIKDLEELNAEISQLAASVADEVVGKERAVAGRACENARNLLGHRLADLLTGATSHCVHQLMIQTAFQTALVAHVNWILSAWFFDGPEGEDILGNVYKRIRNSEAQAAVGRWRQLTRNHLQELMPKKLEDLQQGMMNTMAAIVVLAGYSLETVRPGMQRFGDRAHAIVKLAHSLNKKAGEGVTSSDLQFIKVKSDTPYDPTEMMKIEYIGQPQTNARELIICTRGLGLARSGKAPEANGQFKTTVLLKPQVILYSDFEALVTE